MPSVFQKFGGIRPMAAKLKVPSSTVKSWHAKGEIPDWRRDSIMAAAIRYEVDLSLDELIHVRPDDPEFEAPPPRPFPAADSAADGARVAA